jgi:subtilisin family serine protease
LLAGFDHVAVARFDSPRAALAAVQALYGQPGTRYAHPDFRLTGEMRGAPAAMASATSAPVDEPFYESQWHLPRIGAPQAWRRTRGDERVVVAVLDGGFDSSHPDLADAWAVNTGEIPDNGIDDDGNGYVDDVIGWDFNSRSPDVRRGRDFNHGTAVAGLVGARVNGMGVTGVCPDCRLVPVSLDWFPSDDAQAFRYAASRGAQVITNSWGYYVGTPTTDIIAETIHDVATQGRDGRGIAVFFALPNIPRSDCEGTQPDISALPDVIGIGAANEGDQITSYSGYGPCLDIMAPSGDRQYRYIASTDLTGGIGYNTGRNPSDLPDLDYTNDFGGTSAATPQAAASLALLLSLDPDAPIADAVQRLYSSADKIMTDTAAYDPATGRSAQYGYGRVNVGRAVEQLRAP